MSGLNMNRRTGATKTVKKMIIKPFASPPKLPDNFEDDTWEKLKAATLRVQANEPVSASQEELYRAVEDLCLHKMGQRLYQRLEALCNDHVKSLVQRMDSEASDEPAAFLGRVNSCWTQHCQQMATIRSIFLCLDRTYVLQTSTAQSLWETGVKLFEGHLLPCTALLTKLTTSILRLIETERNGDIIERGLLKSVLEMCTSLSIYTDVFEKPFLQATQMFYSAEAQKHAEEEEVASYLKRAEARLDEENQRVLYCCDPSTQTGLIKCVENELIKKQVENLLSKGFDELMKSSRMDDLKRLYTLFERVDSLDSVDAAFTSYVKYAGMEIVGDTEGDSSMVEKILEFKDQIDAIVSEAFRGSAVLLESKKAAFVHVINVRENRPAELIAKFVDARLRSGGEALTEDELETLLSKVMVLFRFIQAKDVFEAYYKKDLAKRLLLSKSASADAERSMISQLKQECGSSFTVKLEGMFKDLDVSEDIMNAYRSRESDTPKPIELSVRVLTKGSWPNYPKTEVTLPESLLALHTEFSEFYLARHSGCRLNFENSLAQCTLRATYPTGKKELQVSLLQALVLMLFNDNDTLEFGEIKQRTGIEDRELKRILASLSNSKQKLLRKAKDGDDTGVEAYSYNAKFSSKSKKVRMDQVQIKETAQENMQTQAHIVQDRQYAIDAAIVRILKARKELGHAMLMSEIFSELKFPAKPVDVKKRIESLITRDYVERDEQNAQVYKYVA